MVFWLTYAVGTPLQALLEQPWYSGLARLVTALPLRRARPGCGLLADGVIGGAGTMLTFVPILAIFFAVLALLEDVGYMARAAYVMDRFMHLMGLHGKFPSAVPGLRLQCAGGHRRAHHRVAPGAAADAFSWRRWSPARRAWLVVLAIWPRSSSAGRPLVALGLVGAHWLCWPARGVLGKWCCAGSSAAFIMELPLYHRPNARTIGLHVWQRTAQFPEEGRHASSGLSVVVWALVRRCPTADRDKLPGVIGRLLEPVGALMGLDWQMIVALLSSFVVIVYQAARLF